MMMVGSFVAGFVSDKVGSRIKFIQYVFVGMAVFATVYLLIPYRWCSSTSTYCSKLPLLWFMFI